MSAISKSTSLKLIISLLVVGLLSACSGHRTGEHRADIMFDIIAYKLDFNDEQEALLTQIKSEIKAIREQTQDQRDKQRQEFVTHAGRYLRAPRR